MRMRLLSIVMLISFLLGFTYGNSIAGNQLTERQSLDILKIQIQKDKLYDSWAPNLSCILFFTEKKTKDYFEFALHEKHGRNCSGDPNTSPVVDRFRVNRLTKRIQWYDPVEGELLPYKAVLKTRLKK
jgi:hypothetical protein